MSEPKSPQDILTEIKRLSKLIADIQRKFDSGKFKGYDAAIGLQKLKRDRQVEMSKLSKFTCIPHDDPDSLPPFFKRNRAEVREFMGVEYIPGTENEYL